MFHTASVTEQTLDLSFRLLSGYSGYSGVEQVITGLSPDTTYLLTFSYKAYFTEDVPNFVASCPITVLYPATDRSEVVVELGSEEMTPVTVSRTFTTALGQTQGILKISTDSTMDNYYDVTLDDISITKQGS